MLVKQDAPLIDLFKKREIIDVEPGGVTMTYAEVIKELDRRLHEEGVQDSFAFGCADGEYARTKWLEERMGQKMRPVCFAMRGSSEAYWVDLAVAKFAPLEGPHRFLHTIASHKAWSWQEAVEIAALTAQLLDITD